MHYLPPVLALVLAGCSLLHLGDPDRVLWMAAYGVGALLALAVCKPVLNAWTLRILALASTGTMLLYLAGFFSRAPYLGEEWYRADGSGGTLALLLAGFCMMPVISAYTCRLKSLTRTA